jgi:hypothetical protein
MKEYKNFYETELGCTAILVDWIKLNKINSDPNQDFMKYFGNYFADDSNSVYAVFFQGITAYCVLIDK